jgi:hypothetical protein
VVGRAEAGRRFVALQPHLKVPTSEAKK